MQPKITLIMQIFEWCQYMVMSGKCIITDYDPSTTSTREESLCDNVFSLLLDVYRKDIPRYGALTEEYKLNLKKAENARRKSSFPDMKNWIPSGGLKDGDLELLQGPTNCAIVNERLVIENVNTGRLVTYAAFDGDLLRPLAEVRCSFSFIRIITDEDLPTFARIKMCLSHTFAGSSHKLLLVYPFPIPQLDAESNIWWVSFDPNQQEEPDKAVILPVTSVSPPIVVAWEGGKLWFLDV